MHWPGSGASHGFLMPFSQSRCGLQTWQRKTRRSIDSGPGLPAPAKWTHPAYDIFNHIALEVSSKSDVDKWHSWLKEDGLDVVGPTDHGIIYSIYFFDPNGVRLEITAPLEGLEQPYKGR